mmetsp:Transcript_1469/g.3916  ORF Transcript_1469/g.3916 Transcript_1469/m.3916 type:complete len:176 (-) Transcript_1469:908-1435(-)
MQKLRGAWGAGSAPIVNAAAQRAGGPSAESGVDGTPPQQTHASKSTGASASQKPAQQTQQTQQPQRATDSASRSARVGSGSAGKAEKSSGETIGFAQSASRFDVDEAAAELNQSWQETLAQLRQSAVSDESGAPPTPAFERPFVYRSSSTPGSRDPKNDFEAMMRAAQTSRNNRR